MIRKVGHDPEDLRREAEDLAPITAPYLLVSGISCFIDENGKRWTDALWHKDLIEHLHYLKTFTLAAPLRRKSPGAGAKCLSDDPRFSDIDYVDLPASDSLLDALSKWPRTFASLWRAAGTAEIVHAGVADWPIPTGWAATLAAKLRRRALLINIESAFWRVPKRASLAKRMRSGIWERINRWCVRQADLPLFTHREFAQQMLLDPSRGHVFQASWIDADIVLDEQAAQQSWDSKAGKEFVSLLFVGRLVPEKGVHDLLDAMSEIKLPLRLDFIGSGDLADTIRDAAFRDDRIRLLAPMPYDASFFEIVRQYDAVVVPSRTDEQPRIAYDAYSQAVPVLATRTGGNAECVVHGETGYLAPLGSALALSEVLRRAQSDRAALRKMGMRALRQACSYTHQEMHRRRWRLLDNFIRSREPGSRAQ
jgi:glycosyltransferase involved in cell wall biosynthesis